jgi:hypothetical protein
MKLTGKNRSSGRKTCPSATLSTTNPTWTKPGSNPGLRGERPATNRLSYEVILHGFSIPALDADNCLASWLYMVGERTALHVGQEAEWGPEPMSDSCSCRETNPESSVIQLVASLPRSVIYVVDMNILPFLEVLKLSSRGTYCMSYTSVVLGRRFLSLLMRYTAYLNASSALLSFWSSVKIAPVIIQPHYTIIQHSTLNSLIVHNSESVQNTTLTLQSVQNTTLTLQSVQNTILTLQSV